MRKTSDSRSASARRTAGGLLIAALLASAWVAPALAVDPATEPQIKPKDARLTSERVEHPSPKGHGKVKGYLVRPAKSKGKLPGVLLIHENRGLTPHIEDVARRLALLGYVVYAPDGLTSLGGYPGDENKARDMQSKLDRPTMTQDFLAAFRYLKARPDCTGKVAAVGFGYGGTVVNELAALAPDLAAGVSFYGFGLKNGEDVARIKAPLLLHHAGTDERINTTWPPYEKALKQYGKRYTRYAYPDKFHAFFNDMTYYYDKSAAQLAWKRTTAFLKKYLS